MQDALIGTAGHIDHGKTTLLRTLTGIDTDRLKEEKRRGITIDIGFAHMRLGPYRVGFIDVPGHEKFVKNMLAGIGGIHLVLLVVAADESVMPQTIEHFQICKLLEIPRGIVVLTKTKLVETELLALVEEEVRELLKGSFLEQAPVVPVDSLAEEGLDNLKKVMLEQIDQIKRQAPPRVFRLPIDRVFTVRGFGTVVTGTLNAGKLEKEESVTVYPSGKQGKVRGIEIFNEKVELARAGQRTALDLTGLQRSDLERGMVLSRLATFTPSHMFDAVVHLLPDAPTPLRHRSPIRFHHGSGEFLGRSYLLEGDRLQPGQTGLVQLRLDRLAVCCPKDHFILRRYSPVTTIGGGIILDNAPSKHSKQNLSRVLPQLQQLRALWETRDSALDATLVEYFVKSKGVSGVDLPQLVSRTGLLEDYLLSLVKQLESVTLIPQEPILVVARASVEECKEALLQFLVDFHAENPLASGVPREELRKRFARHATPSYFQFVLEALEAEKKVQLHASIVALYGKRAKLGKDQQKICTQMLKAIERNALQPPVLDALVKELPFRPDDIRDVYHFLLQAGDLVRISGHFVLSRQQIDFLKAQVREFFPAGQPFTVPEFKDLFKISRKFAIPYLEFLDREHVTRRLGDKRVVLEKNRSSGHHALDP